jgi:hypothetical protein
MVAAVICLTIATWHPADAGAAQRPPHDTVTATWYGPDFYGHAFACSHLDIVPNRYSEKHSRGVAHMTLPCGTRLTVCHRWRCFPVLVIDTGAFPSDQLDLTARTARDLCGCIKPHTMQVRWRRGW